MLGFSVAVAVGVADGVGVAVAAGDGVTKTTVPLPPDELFCGGFAEGDVGATVGVAVGASDGCSGSSPVARKVTVIGSMSLYCLQNRPASFHILH